VTARRFPPWTVEGTLTGRVRVMMSRGRAASPLNPSSDREYGSRSEDVATENSATLKDLIAPSEWPELPLGHKPVLNAPGVLC
jgi:hypothetical protein